VVVDEAGLAHESTSLCPMIQNLLDMSVVLLAGDDKQLAPVSLSAGMGEYAEQRGTSLFKRLRDAETQVPYNMLRTNYKISPTPLGSSHMAGCDVIHAYLSPR
jgi:superfamily I DNA and/or RNA helicase